MENAIASAAEKFGLTHLQKVSVSTDRAVVFARSEEYGPVVLKLDTDWSQLEDSCNMLEKLQSECCSQVFHFEKCSQQISRNRSISYGLMLSERILPGTSLRQEASMQKRIQVFCDLFRRIHRKDPWGQEYLQWLKDMVEYSKMYLGASRLRDMVSKAYAICLEMYEKYPCSFLLHGDLHHDNMVLAQDGTYRIIDPKAVGGPEILDTPRFLLNELGMGSQDEEAHIRQCIAMIHSRLGYPREDLCKAFYMETVLANLWRMEDGDEPLYEQLALAERILE